MYNISMKVVIAPSTEEIVVKLTADTMANAKAKVATIYGVQSSAITVASVGYIQEILAIPEE